MAAKTRTSTKGKTSTPTKSAAGAGRKATAARLKPKPPDNKTRFSDNPRVIRKWAEERGGRPATVRGTRRGKADPAGVLRIDFPGGAGDPPLKEISWDEFFEKFDDNNLAMIYQNMTADGQVSRFCRFVTMETAEESNAEETKAPPLDGKPVPAPADGQPGAKAKAPRRRTHKVKTTVNPRTIRRWAEERGGKPATVRGTRRGKADSAGVLRIDFPGGAGDPPLKGITWDEFFEKMAESQLVFLYQERTLDGSPSRFCRFISVETAIERA